MRVGSWVVAMLVLGFGQDAQAFCTEWSVFECVDEGHESATRTVDFLRGPVWSEIDDAGWWQDIGAAGDDDPRHAQYCQLAEMSAYINDEYDNAIAALDPNAPRPFAAASAFGRLLHPIQDFYAHSNWVELLEQTNGSWIYVDPENLLDTGTGPFRGLEPLSWVRDDILVGTIPAG